MKKKYLGMLSAAKMRELQTNIDRTFKCRLRLLSLNVNRDMNPWSFELLIMLRSNKDMRCYGTLQAIIDRRKNTNRDATIAGSSASMRLRQEDDEMEENIDFTYS